MTEAMYRSLSHQLNLRVATGIDARPPDDVIRSGARTVDEAVVTYGLLRLAAARRRRPRGYADADVAEQALRGAFHWLRPQGGPYRERPVTSGLELKAALSAATHGEAQELRAPLHDLWSAVPTTALPVPSLLRNQWLLLAALMVCTAGAGVALHTYVAPPQPAPAAPPQATRPRARFVRAEELARRPLGDYVAVQCDYVQNSEQRGRLRAVTLCGVGRRILAVAGGNRHTDHPTMVLGRVEPVPDNPMRPEAWADALRKQIQIDPNYYDFYLKRDGEDPHDDESHEADRHRDGHQGRPSDDSGSSAAALRTLAVSSTLVSIAGWIVWFRMRQLRRRAAYERGWV
jgi:hypothetical protein